MSPSPRISVSFGTVTVEIYLGYTVTRFDDGKEVVGLHAEQPGQADTAARTGFASVVEMNVEHDMMHSRLAYMLGLPHSPALWDVAHGVPATALHDLEEDAVLAVQAYARAARSRFKAGEER